MCAKKLLSSKQTQIRNAGDNPTSILTKFYNKLFGPKNSIFGIRNNYQTF